MEKYSSLIERKQFISNLQKVIKHKLGRIKKSSPCNAEPDRTLGLNTTLANTENIYYKCTTG